MRPRRGRMEVEVRRQSGRSIWTIWRDGALYIGFQGDANKTRVLRACFVVWVVDRVVMRYHLGWKMVRLQIISSYNWMLRRDRRKIRRGHYPRVVNAEIVGGTTIIDIRYELLIIGRDRQKRQWWQVEYRWDSTYRSNNNANDVY